MLPRVLTALAALTLGALLPTPGYTQQPTAQQPAAASSDTAMALPIKPARTVRFTTDEATWISLDVSPDGKTIVFDILGDLYTIPIAGGTATRLTSGVPWDCMPRWSPDGRTIAFISDRDGGDNLWVVNADGTRAHRITKEVDNALSSPMWSPDGQYVVVRRFGAYPTEENYLTNVPLWLYHVGGGSGTQLFPSVATRKTTNTGAAFSADGRTVYFGSHAGGYTGENFAAYQIIAFDRERGTETALTASSGGAYRPVTSRDGRGWSTRRAPGRRPPSAFATSRRRRITGSSARRSATMPKATRRTTSSPATRSPPTRRASSSTAAARSSALTSRRVRSA